MNPYTTERGVTMALGLLDTVAVILLVLIVVGVILRLGHLQGMGEGENKVN